VRMGSYNPDMLRRLFIFPVALALFGAPAGVISTQTAERYRWGDCCDGWYLVKNDRINVIQERMPPGSSETRHLHHRAQQFFFVLAGEAVLEVDGRELTLHEREGALVPAGTAHRMQNRSKRDLEIVVTSEPPSHGDREEAPK
jgi:mannose-6-phosphate isomerase-like protein (cupin superfamily)